MLDNLRGILENGATHAETRKFDSAVLINSRLYPDMFPLSRQVQIATDNAKGCASRLAGIDPPNYEDTESTFPELYARIDKTIAFLKTAARHREAAGPRLEDGLRDPVRWHSVFLPESPVVCPWRPARAHMLSVSSVA